jgi:hypothetical protein
MNTTKDRREPVSLDLPILRFDSINLNSSESNLLPEYYTLKHYEYSIFGSLDFRSAYARRPECDNLRKGLFRQLISKVSKQSPIHRRNLDFFATDEWSAAMEMHIHFVVKKQPRLDANLTAVLRCFKDVWENQIHAGRCVVRAYQTERNGLRYICKRQKGFDGHELQKMPVCNRAFRERMAKDRREGRLPELKIESYAHN